MTQLQDEIIAQDAKRIDYFKWAITIMTTLVLGLTVMNATLLANIRTVQTQQASELVRLKAVQDANVVAVGALTVRVNAIESDKIQALKEWTMANFIMKPQ